VICTVGHKKPPPAHSICCITGVLYDSHTPDDWCVAAAAAQLVTADVISCPFVPAGCQFVPLLVLGGLLGLLFVHTRNLLAPMLLHSFWNLFVFFEITKGIAAIAL